MARVPGQLFTMNAKTMSRCRRSSSVISFISHQRIRTISMNTLNDIHNSTFVHGSFMMHSFSQDKKVTPVPENELKCDNIQCNHLKRLLKPAFSLANLVPGAMYHPISVAGTQNRHFLSHQASPFWMEQKRYSGHNKWSSIKYIKGRDDQKKQKMKTVYSTKFRAVIRGNSNDTDPKSNPALRALIAEALKDGIPRDFITRQLEKFNSPVDCSFTIQLMSFDNIVTFIVSANVPKSEQSGFISSIKKVAKKQLFKISTSLNKNTFEKKGIVEVTNDPAVDIDQATEDAITANAEDVQEKEDVDGNKILQFVCDPSFIQGVEKNLSNLGYSITFCDIGFFPMDIVSDLSDEVLQKLQSLREDIYNDTVYGDDVRIYSNVEQFQ